MDIELDSFDTEIFNKITDYYQKRYNVTDTNYIMGLVLYTYYENHVKNHSPEPWNKQWNLHLVKDVHQTHEE